MARNTTLNILPRSWTQITESDVTGLRADNQGSSMLLLLGTAGTTAPVSTDGAVQLPGRSILLPDVALSALWPGVAGVARVWAWNPSPETIPLSVSHA